MPKDFVYETAITIDHESGIMLVDTTVAGIASQLLRAGFTEKTKANSRPYRRFRGAADQLRFRKPKEQRRKAPEGRRFLPGRAVHRAIAAQNGDRWRVAIRHPAGSCDGASDGGNE